MCWQGFAASFKKLPRNLNRSRQDCWIEGYLDFHMRVKWLCPRTDPIFVYPKIGYLPSSKIVASLVKDLDLCKGLCLVKTVVVHFSERSDGK